MKTELYAARYARLRKEPAWRLLAAHTSPEVLALLEALLYDHKGPVPAEQLAARLDQHLDRMRAAGHDMPMTAAAYLREWLGAGWVERRLPEGASDEEYELSAAAVMGLRAAQGFDRQQTVATESRLSLVIEQLDRLERDTDPDPKTRLERLHAERDRIDSEIARVVGGDVPVLSPDRALERMRQVTDLASELVDDFRYVREEFSGLNRRFRERILSHDERRGTVLADLFAGIDVIATSEPGRVFSAFWSLLTDPERSAQLEDAISALKARGHLDGLDRAERRMLVSLTETLLTRAGRVNDARTSFARSLRVFVQSREFQEQQRIQSLLKQASAAALRLRGTIRPTQRPGPVLQLSIASIASISQWRLHEPALPIAVDAPRSLYGPAITPALARAMVQESGIDLRELRAILASLLGQATQVSIGQALDAVPATQGLGTIVGYVALGLEYGHITEARESVAWSTLKGIPIKAQIPLIYFLAGDKEAIRG